MNRIDSIKGSIESAIGRGKGVRLSHEDASIVLSHLVPSMCIGSKTTEQAMAAILLGVIRDFGPIPQARLVTIGCMFSSDSLLLISQGEDRDLFAKLRDNMIRRGSWPVDVSPMDILSWIDIARAAIRDDSAVWTGLGPNVGEFGQLAQPKVTAALVRCIESYEARMTELREQRRARE